MVQVSTNTPDAQSEQDAFALVRSPKVCRIAWRFFRHLNIPPDVDRLIRYHWDHWIREKGEIFPRDSIVAYDLGVSQRTVLRWKRELVLRGLLIVIPRFDHTANDRQQSSHMNYGPMIERLRVFVKNPAKRVKKPKKSKAKRGDTNSTPGATPVSLPPRDTANTPIKIRISGSEDENAINALASQNSADAEVPRVCTSAKRESPFYDPDLRKGPSTLPVSSCFLEEDMVKNKPSLDQAQAVLDAARVQSEKHHADVAAKKSKNEGARKQGRREQAETEGTKRVTAEDTKALVRTWNRLLNKHYPHAVEIPLNPDQKKRERVKDYVLLRSLIENWGPERANKIITFAMVYWTKIFHPPELIAPGVAYVVSQATQYLNFVSLVTRYNEAARAYQTWGQENPGAAVSEDLYNSVVELQSQMQKSRLL